MIEATFCDWWNKLKLFLVLQRKMEGVVKFRTIGSTMGFSVLLLISYYNNALSDQCDSSCGNVENVLEMVYGKSEPRIINRNDQRVGPRITPDTFKVGIGDGVPVRTNIIGGEDVRETKFNSVVSKSDIKVDIASYGTGGTAELGDDVDIEIVDSKLEALISINAAENAVLLGKESSDDGDGDLRPSRDVYILQDSTQSIADVSSDARITKSYVYMHNEITDKASFGTDIILDKAMIRAINSGNQVGNRIDSAYRDRSYDDDGYVTGDDIRRKHRNLNNQIAYGAKLDSTVEYSGIEIHPNDDYDGFGDIAIRNSIIIAASYANDAINSINAATTNRDENLDFIQVNSQFARRMRVTATVDHSDIDIAPYEPASRTNEFDDGKISLKGNSILSHAMGNRAKNFVRGWSKGGTAKNN
jgi:hypothetical protein